MSPDELVVEVRVRRRATALAASVVLVGGLATALLPSGCDAETTYHCAVVETDPQRASGRTLLLDGAEHSYVDLADPTHLEYPYAHAVVAAVGLLIAAGAVTAAVLAGTWNFILS